MPLGSILPWIPEPSGEGSDESKTVIPSGFAICDGREITVGPWAGQTTPDLTDLFLRGGTEQTYLNYEDDAIQNHLHIDPGHTHQDGGHSHG